MMMRRRRRRGRNGRGKSNLDETSVGGNRKLDQDTTTKNPEKLTVFGATGFILVLF